MAITSELVGSLQVPGFAFLVNSPTTYALPKFPYGASIMAVRWGGSSELSYDLLDRETGEVKTSMVTASHAMNTSVTATAKDGLIAKGALLRSNNSTPMYVYISPNTTRTPPVWNG